LDGVTWLNEANTSVYPAIRTSSNNDYTMKLMLWVIQRRVI